MPITIELTDDEALVLDALLEEFIDQPALRISHPSERVALCNLSGLIEAQLVPPFRTDYELQLARARKRLTPEDN